jgi:hypothetical protein
MSPHYRVGDLAVYHATRYGLRPSCKASRVFPAMHGDNYAYQVDKYWFVANLQSDGYLLLATRRGKLRNPPPTTPAS